MLFFNVCLPPIAVNNTLAEPDRDKGKATERKTETGGHKDSKDKDQEGTAGGKDSVGGKDKDISYKNTTEVDGTDTSVDVIVVEVPPGEGADKVGNAGESKVYYKTSRVLFLK